jgi:hypothetical protein
VLGALGVDLALGRLGRLRLLDERGMARKVDTSRIFPPLKYTCARRNRRPMRRQLRNSARIWSGVALVAMSKSFGSRPMSRSRTHPPTR